MKNTPNVSGNGTSGATKNSSSFSINPGEPVSVADMIREAKKNANPDAIKEPTTYAQPNAPEENPEPEQTPEAKPAQTPEATPEPVPAAPEPAPAPVQTMALVKTRSRSEEIEFQVEKSAKLQLLNTQLQSLKGKLTELKAFSYEVEKDDNHRYGRLAIFDDNNREFKCSNNGLAALVVEQLKTLFEQKIDEKETELLTVSKS